MSVSEWEYTKALSNQLRAVWDAKRGDAPTWKAAFESARDCLARAHERDARIIGEMTWEEFRALQGWHETSAVAGND